MKYSPNPWRHNDTGRHPSFSSKPNVFSVRHLTLPQFVAKNLPTRNRPDKTFEMETNSFRSLLQTELVRRCEKNQRYSLRAYAKSLGVDVSTLSQILRGKRALTPKMTKTLAHKMDMNPSTIDALVEAKTSKTDNAFKELTADLFEVLSDWYHFTILELMNTKHFRSDPSWIAKSLGITISEVNISIDRLQRLEMLEIDPNGKWIDLTGGKTNLGDPALTNQAFRRYQKKILELSQRALEQVAIEKRDHSGTTMAIDTEKLPKAKEIIQEFRRQMGKLLTGSNEDQVYQLQVSLFPLSDIQGEKQ
jgi:transcriptional regulator with XRE-family HTH domain